MVDQARTAYTKLESLTDDPELLANMLSEVMAAPGEKEAVAIEDEAVPSAENEMAVEAEPEPVVEDEPAFAAPPAPENAVLNEFVSDLESSLGHEFAEPAKPAAKEEFERETEIVAHAATDPGLVSHLDFMSSVKPEAQEAEPAPVVEEHPAEEVAASESEPGGLGEFVADLEESLGDGFLQEPAVVQPEHEEAAAEEPAAPEPVHASTPAPRIAPMPPAAMPVPAAHPAAAASAAAAAPALESTAPAATFRTSVRPAAPAVPPAAAAAGVDLADMFGELKHELEEDVAAANEDPETHYNLGVAFREMGLLDEAIGELQKVCQAVEHGHPFPQLMQTYTWLAQCFLDKGIPEAAIRWYDKALKLPGIDQDTRTALHYELAASYESAQNRDAALQHFMEVYGSNIDYRDVGERIKALRS